MTHQNSNAIPTLFDGIRFRSRIEARWAVFFKALGIEAQYEPEGFTFSDGAWYLPDFYLPEFGYWIEIKGAIPTAQEMNKAAMLAQSRQELVFVFYGNIPNPPEYTNDSAAIVIPASDGLTNTDTGYRWTQCDVCGQYNLTWQGVAERFIHRNNECLGSDNACPDMTPDLLQAYAMARGARFEHGERTRLERMLGNK